MIFCDIDNININYYVTADLTSTTHNNGFRSNEVMRVFFHIIFNIWNSPSAQTVKSNTTESFKKKMFKHSVSVHP